MKTRTIILPLILLFQFATAQQSSIKELAAGFDKVLSAQFKNNEPGASVLVTRNGQTLYKKAFGMANLELNVPMQSENVFRIGSITKQFTAIAILQLMEHGKLDLRDEITKYIPDYPTQGNKITIQHLLTHTSGIRNYSSMKDTIQRVKLDVSPKEMIEYFKNQPMRFAPGTKWEYSNSNYFILGFIIEKITGKTYAQYLDENFFVPLGMTHSLYSSEEKIIKKRANGYSRNGKGFFENAPYVSMTQPYAAGSILSTVEDLFKWNQAVQSYKLVKKETLDKAWTRYQLADGSTTNYGYGWRMGFIQESASLWHGGLVQGFITMAIYLPEEKVFVAVFTNCESYTIDDVIAKLAAIAIGQSYEYKESVVEPSILQEYAGVYENGKGQRQIISLRDNRVYAQLNNAPKSEIKAHKKDAFYFKNDPLVGIEFKRNPSGAVEQLVTKSCTAIEKWARTNKPIPSEDGINVDETILKTYAGVYEITPEMNFTVTIERQKIFLQASGQEKLQMFAETETKFFLKVNDAQLEFIKDNSGNVNMVTLIQGGRKAQAKKVK